MAIYDYRCNICGKVFEYEHAMMEHPEVFCPDCKGKAEQLFEPSGIAFKGSGFYNTDQKTVPKAPVSSSSSDNT